MFFFHFLVPRLLERKDTALLPAKWVFSFLSKGEKLCLLRRLANDKGVEIESVLFSSYKRGTPRYPKPTPMIMKP